MKKIILFFSLSLLSSCCFDIFDPLDTHDLCADQVFTETRKVSLNAPYNLKTNKVFLEANTLTADKIRKALQVPNYNFVVKRIEINSAKIKYNRLNENTSAALFVNIGVVGNTFNQLLLAKQNVLLPLVDIPETFISKGLKINEFLNGQAIVELKKILSNYIDFINNDGISFIITGEPSPPLTTAHFSLEFVMDITVVYEVCRFVPLGTGERLCD